ncbi:hypothetical protein [Actinomadura terrae]|uniref:hypothetical protein n=1 Tax=Actinomadura terrae TaxID=604353 RepID=UPI001FA6E59E|nr:hypothetical protein [Actinomadura terrae]
MRKIVGRKNLTWRGRTHRTSGRAADRRGCALLDEHCTTGTDCCRRKEFVGRIVGDDIGYVGITGAEARAAETRDH